MDAPMCSNGDIPAVVSQHRHFPVHKAPKNHPFSSSNHFIRAIAKRNAQSVNSYTPRIIFSCNRCHERVNDCSLTSRRSELEHRLRHEIQHGDTDWRPHTRGGPGVSWSPTPRARGARWSNGDGVADVVEGRDLAHSTLPLPSDRFRFPRTPTLEREEAFRDASTAKANALSATQDAETAELYRMGLLYDDEQDRGEGFNLNSIEHEQPMFLIRSTTRLRRNKKSRSPNFREALPLNLSFTDLGRDQVLAQYLSSPSSPVNEKSIPEMSDTSSYSSNPLCVIYELAGSRASLDVETSQPPDLVLDKLLSDYDCFSDSDLDDLPSQREVMDSTAAPSLDTWIVLGDDP